MAKGKKPIEQYDHRGKKRVNNPPVGLVTPGIERPQRFIRADSMPLLRHDSYYTTLYLLSAPGRSAEMNIKLWEAEQNDEVFNVSKVQ